MTAFNDSSYYSETFSELEMQDQCIEGVEFDSCHFKQCNFSQASFERCNFVDCEFEQCDLNLLDLGYSKFSDSLFRDCKMRGIDWSKVSWPRVLFAAPVQFFQCLLDDASFYGLQLPELVMEDCRACRADFREADLNQASFQRSDLSGSQFLKSVLEGADFRDAQNYHIDIFHNKIRGAKFSRYEALSLLDSLEIELSD